MVRGRSGLTPQEEHLKKIIAENIKNYLSKNNKKAAELQRNTGISQSSISEYINGKTLPSPGNTQKIADYFGILKSDIDPRYKLGYSLHEWQQEHSDPPSISEEVTSAIGKLTKLQQELLIKLSKLDLDDVLVETAKIISKSDERLKKQIYRYAKLEYSEYEKEQEEKNADNRNTAG